MDHFGVTSHKQVNRQIPVEAVVLHKVTVDLSIHLIPLIEAENI